jgi:hypothetical protein
MAFPPTVHKKLEIQKAGLSITARLFTWITDPVKASAGWRDSLGLHPGKSPSVLNIPFHLEKGCSPPFN